MVILNSARGRQRGTSLIGNSRRVLVVLGGCATQQLKISNIRDLTTDIVF